MYCSLKLFFFSPALLLLLLISLSCFLHICSKLISNSNLALTILFFFSKEKKNQNS